MSDQQDNGDHGSGNQGKKGNKGKKGMKRRDFLIGAATGVAAVFEGRVVRLGEVPETPKIEAMLAWLDTRGDDVFATDELASEWPEVKGRLQGFLAARAA